MLGSGDLMAFVPSTDLDRAAAFYGGVLGLEVQQVTPYACVLLAGGTTLRVTKVDGFTPHPFTVLGWVVPDIAGTLDALAQRGVAAFAIRASARTPGDLDHAGRRPGGVVLRPGRQHALTHPARALTPSPRE